MTMLLLQCTSDKIATAAERVVKEGKVVVYPTDTVYGIGCDPYNHGAVETVIRMKGRDERKPLPILCSSAEDAARIVGMNESATRLAEKLWPGPLTIIAKSIDARISEGVTAGTDTIGVRVPNHPCALQLIEKCNGLLVGTSANRSGQRPARTASEVLQMFQGFDVLLDGGRTPLGVESSVVDLSAGGEEVRIVREGYITREQIRRALGNV